MKKIKTFFDEKPALSFVIGASVILLVAVIVFLFSKGDPNDPYSITGWQAIAGQSAGFWIGAVVCSILIALLAVRAIKVFKDEGTQNFGLYWMAFAILLAIGFGKGCTDKANNGVTSSKGRPVAVPKDTTRIPAEDLLQK